MLTLIHSHSVRQRLLDLRLLQRWLQYTVLTEPVIGLLAHLKDPSLDLHKLVNLNQKDRHQVLLLFQVVYILNISDLLLEHQDFLPLFIVQFNAFQGLL